MLILFTEQDLVSFGNFMVSQDRAKPYLENEIIKDELPKYLSQVNKFDLDNWLRIRQEEEKALMAPQQTSKEPQVKTLEDLPVEDEENTLSDDSTRN